MDLLSQTLDALRAADADAYQAAREHQTRLTKPMGSLGALEEVGNRLAAMAGQCPPPQPEPHAVVLFAGDHGVLQQGVSPWPQEVTAQMIANFLTGGAVISVFGRQMGSTLHVVDVGVATTIPDLPLGPDGTPAGGTLHRRRVQPGTADFTAGPALSREAAVQAVETGIDIAGELIDGGCRMLVPGDMGIGNTTASAALIAAFTGSDAQAVTGRGTGIDDAALRIKVDVVRRGLELHRPDPRDPVGVLAAFGGLEHAAIAGLLLGAAARRTPVILDGVIVQSAALVAAALRPEAMDYWIAGHRSAEPGSQVALGHMGLRALLDLGLRLGEASGGVLAVPLVQAAARILREGATFESAGVSEAR
jgi:nicotinate-nucleotide--dimethylbenzimidazole phosphoribosyltransferase